MMVVSTDPDGWILISDPGIPTSTVSEFARCFRGGKQHPLTATISGTPASRAAAVATFDDTEQTWWPEIEAPVGQVFAISPDAIDATYPQLDLVGLKNLDEWIVSSRDAGWRHVACPFVSVQSNTSLFNFPQIAHQAERLGLATGQIRVLLDARCFQQPPNSTGTHLLVLETAKALAESTSLGKLTIACSSAPGRDFLRERLIDFQQKIQIVDFDNVPKFISEIDVVYRPYQILNPSELSSISKLEKPWIIGQLDMIGFSNRSYYKDERSFYLSRNLQRAALRNADVVVTLSHVAKDHILAEVPDISGDKVVVIPCGVDHLLEHTACIPSALIDRHSKRFLLCLSSSARHKNRIHALRVFSMVREIGLDVSIVIVGPSPALGSSWEEESEFIKTLPKSTRDEVFRIGGVSEDEKSWLLHNAAVVLYPSINEGFGLIPFEAAAAGTPALTSGGQVFREVLGDDCVFPDSWRPEDWASVLASWLTEPKSAEGQTRAISKRAETYQWAKVSTHIERAAIQATQSKRANLNIVEGPQRWKIEHYRAGLSPLAKVDAHSRGAVARVRKIIRYLNKRRSNTPR